MPCYNLLENIIPESKPLKEGVQQNLFRWKTLADAHEKAKEAAREAETEADTSAADSTDQTKNSDEASSPTTTTLNGEAKENGSTNPPTPTESTQSSASPNKSLGKQASSSVPVVIVNKVNLSSSLTRSNK